ncbi:peptide/nickel transport system substrate-binding protein [Kribbella aluminosa]|uniref:Peptide/nickel transport system substrate-binding protein n=1 Tax=Kribbella aluminosa TaxID=416017 RepID=A0ABS4UKD8_9ACTN|nr:ABC transporter substrate-binding protein [Kribbella aluminosa]MBP2352112.1 peptide/nickel transport system substrate-binding protein [Kribbella aluminosa]
MLIRRCSAVLAAAALAVGAGACSGAGASSAAAKTLTIGNVLDNNSFDPTQLNIGNQMQYWSPVFDTLLTRDKDNRLQPWLATSWKYDAKRTTLSLTLKSGVKFTDGTPFDATAVKDNLTNLAAGTGQNSYMSRSIATYQIVGPAAINLKLKAPDPGLIDYLASVGGAMASPRSLHAKDVATTPVGCGPYVLDRAGTVAGSTYTYKRNPDYWNAAAFPYDKVVIKPMTDLTARLNALKAGQLNATLTDTNSLADAERSGLTVSTTPVNWNGLLLMDRDGKLVPALKDLRVRKAINYAFDREAILKNVSHGAGALTTQIFNAAGDGYDKSLDGIYDYDPAKAKQLLAEAGYGGGFSITMPESPGFAQYNPIIEQQLGAIGITVKWVKVPANAVIPEVLSGKYPVVFMTLGSQSAWQDIQKAVTRTSPWNPLKAGDPELDKLLAAAQNAPAATLPAAMKAVSKWIVDNAWFDPWYRENSVYLSDAKTAVTMQAYNVAPSIGSFAPKE